MVHVSLSSETMGKLWRQAMIMGCNGAACIIGSGVSSVMSQQQVWKHVGCFDIRRLALASRHFQVGMAGFAWLESDGVGGRQNKSLESGGGIMAKRKDINQNATAGDCMITVQSPSDKWLTAAICFSSSLDLRVASCLATSRSSMSKLNIGFFLFLFRK